MGIVGKNEPLGCFPFCGAGVIFSFCVSVGRGLTSHLVTIMAATYRVFAIYQVLGQTSGT